MLVYILYTMRMCTCVCGLQYTLLYACTSILYYTILVYTMHLPMLVYVLKIYYYALSICFTILESHLLCHDIYVYTCICSIHICLPLEVLEYHTCMHTHLLYILWPKHNLTICTLYTICTYTTYIHRTILILCMLIYVHYAPPWLTTNHIYYTHTHTHIRYILYIYSHTILYIYYTYILTYYIYYTHILYYIYIILIYLHTIYTIHIYYTIYMYI